MKQILLHGKYGEGKYAKVDDEDYTELSQYRWHMSSKGYISMDGWGSVFLMHRWIMNCPKGLTVDHINHDKSDNQKENLRICTNQQNCWNCNYTKGKYSKCNGVTWHKQNRKWQAQIKQNGRQIYLGLFCEEEDAALAYDKAAIRLRGEFACLNFPDVDLWSGT